MSKVQIQKFIENDELDLSLQNLNDIPIKEISKFPKIKSIDLSCNALENIAPELGALTSVTKLDLSKNKIQFLPEDIGKLINLQYLDLRSNKLTSLPESMCNLKKLKWLDLKDNPLNANLSKAAGDCLNKEKCERCAVNVMEFLKQSKTKTLKRNEKKKRREEELARQKSLEEEKQREFKKQEKNELRNKRKNEMEERKRQLLEFNEKNNGVTLNSHESDFAEKTITNLKSGKFMNFFQLLICLLVVVGLTTIALSLLVFCNQDSIEFNSRTYFWCKKLNHHLPNSLIFLRDLLHGYVKGIF